MVVIVVTINSMQQPALTKATQGLPQMLITSVAGMLLGLMMGYYASMVIGAAVGAVAGGVFFARTPKGAALRFPSKRFFAVCLCQGLPHGDKRVAYGHRHNGCCGSLQYVALKKYF